MREVAKLPASERAALFNEAGANRGLAPGIVEKDFWSCWVLDRLFTLPGDNPHLIFKGGTSLAKAYSAIQRLSEDVDISFDRKDLGYDGERSPQNAPSGNKAQALLDELVADVTRHIASVLQPRLTESIAQELGPAGKAWRLALDPADPQCLNLTYPASFEAEDYAALAYVNPVIRIELGARGEAWPSERRPVTPYAAEGRPDQFSQPSTIVIALAAERTFWEKATLLHAENHRAANRPLAPRLSRHYYDLAQLYATEHGRRALGDTELLEAVAQHKAVFFRSAWAEYDKARPGTIRLVPPTTRVPELRQDYMRMAPMIFGDPPPFEQILDTVRQIENEINAQHS